ncbi:MAG: hypothetical protein ACR2O6_06180, partial [Ilumatobacteraceae bacterium]
AQALAGATGDSGFTFTITAYAMGDTSSSFLETFDFGNNLNTPIAISQLPPALDTDVVFYTRS